ncbi:MAG: hypothetical protein ACK5TH_21225 [Prosthecobacter sp.]
MIRTLCFACLFVLLFSFRCLAALPEVVVTQVRHDVRGAIIFHATPGYTPPTQEVDEILAQVLREMNSERDPFVLTPEELVDFRKDETSLTFEELARVMHLIKKAARNKPLPHLLSYYDQLLDKKALSPRQKILCHRMMLRAAAAFHLEIPPAPPPAAPKP